MPKGAAGAFLPCPSAGAENVHGPFESFSALVKVIFVPTVARKKTDHCLSVARFGFCFFRRPHLMIRRKMEPLNAIKHSSSVLTEKSESPPSRSSPVSRRYHVGHNGSSSLGYPAKSAQPDDESSRTPSQLLLGFTPASHSLLWQKSASFSLSSTSQISRFTVMYPGWSVK